MLLDARIGLISLSEKKKNKDNKTREIVYFAK